MPPSSDSSRSGSLLAAAAFNAAATAAVSATSPQAFLNDALVQLARLLDLPACAILISAEDGIQRAAAVGLPDRFIPDVAATRLPLGFQSQWSVPLTLPGGDALGMLVAYGEDAAAPGDDELALATAYGSVIALGLDRFAQQPGLAARYQAVVMALTSALDARDDYTGRHATETSDLAQRVGRRLGTSSAQLELISQVAVLHDIGKLGIPIEVLQKPGPLDTDELALMREHPVIGERILSGIQGLEEVALAIRHEHERWDGVGYPDGLAGDQIPLSSRIVFACGAWHAMTSDRPYRPAMSSTQALMELREGAGTQFDPRVAQALLEILGDSSPPPACSPSESRDRALSRQLTKLAAELGAEDLFVFRKVAGQVYSHLGGVGRGAVWAGNLELDSAQEHHLRSAITSRAPVRVELEQPGRIVGPYYGRSAIVIPCAEDSVVVFGSSTDSVASMSVEEAVCAAEQAHALVEAVSPAKRLADELEVLAAVREVTTITADCMGDTLAAIAARTRAALSAEFAAVATLPSEEADAAIGVSAGAWQPVEADAAARALTRFAARPWELPLLSQDVSEMRDAPEGFRHFDGVSSLHVLPIGQPAVAIMLIVHAEPGLRGFTALCQRVAGGVSDAAELVVRRAIAQERLRAENARLAEKVRTDALTGVASRGAWDDALFNEELHCGRSGSPVSVVIVDVDGLKAVNDAAGHAAGDELLRRCARVLADSIRATDLVARIGGDEFGVLLRYATADQASAWCARVDEKMRDGEDSALQWSLGYASMPPYESVAAALAEADRLMYEMKLAHRSSRS